MRNGSRGSVFAVQRGFTPAHHDAAVHEAEIGHFRTFPAAPCGTENKHSSVICGTLPHIPDLALRGNRRERSQYQRLATKYLGEYVDSRVRDRRKHAVL